MTTDHKTNWKERFDEKFTFLVNFSSLLQGKKFFKDSALYPDDIKDFIKQTLHTTLTDLISKLEGEKLKNCNIPQCWHNSGDEKYNAALDKSKQIVEEFIRDLSK